MVLRSLSERRESWLVTFVFTDIEEGGGSIWKTTDGGTTWSSHNTTQFEGGFANFYHAFSANTGMAMGDPTAGYFEIQHTYNGGLTWNRLPSIYIPDPLPEEMGLVNSYSAVGNSIWFATSMGRCFRSTDRGQTNEIYKYMGVLTSAGKSLTQPEKLTIIPNPASTSSLVRIPGIHAAGTLTVRVVDMCGRTVAEYPALPAEWVKLDASSYRSGVYVLQLFSGNTLLGSEKWVIEQPAAF